MEPCEFDDFACCKNYVLDASDTTDFEGKKWYCVGDGAFTFFFISEAFSSLIVRSELIGLSRLSASYLIRELASIVVFRSTKSLI